MKNTNALSVYVVDDDQLFTTSLQEQVKKIPGINTVVRTFSTGEECLKQFKNPPNIMVLDYFLNSSYPEAMNGMQVLKVVKQVSPDTKVVMLSAQDKMEIAVDLIKHGAYDYVIKNDKVFLKTKFALMNAANAITTAHEFKQYKIMVRMVTGVIIGIITTCIMIQVFYPSLFTRI